MDNKATFKGLVDVVNENTFFIRKSYAMYGGYNFTVTDISMLRICVEARAIRNPENHEQMIESYINGMANFLHSALPIPLIEVTYYASKIAEAPEFVREFSFIRPGAGQHSSNLILIEENVRPLRDKIRNYYQELLKSLNYEE